MAKQGTSSPVGSQESVIVGGPSDAEVGVHDDAAYDVDFEYLKTPESNGNGEKTADGETAKVDDKKVETKDEKPLPAESKETKDETVDEPPIAKVAQSKTDDTVPPEKKVASEYEDKLRQLQSVKDQEVSELKKQLETKNAELQQLQAFRVAQEELERSPLSFVARYFPELAEKLDPRRQIIEQLKREFNGEITYDPIEAYTEGTTAWKIRAREEELRDEYSRERARNEISRTQAEQQRQAALQVSKQQVMKDYGLDDAGFEKEIVSWSKSKTLDYSMIAKLRYFDWHVKRAVADALKGASRGGPDKLPANIANVGGGGSDGSADHLKDFANEFGESI